MRTIRRGRDYADRSLVGVLARDRESYRTAARLIRNMRDAAARADRSAEFDTHLADLRERCRRRPALAEEPGRDGL